MMHCNSEFNKNVHVKFFKRILVGCPTRFSEHDCYRVMLAFFCVSGLDVLNALDTLTPEFKRQIIDWLYHLQVHPTPAHHNTQQNVARSQVFGFQGTSTLKVGGDCCNPYESSHLTMTYTALCCLLVLGDDLARVDKPALLHGLNLLQHPDGSWSGSHGGEADMRFVYSAACISYILNDFSTVNVDSMAEFIQRSIGYDGGVGQRPGLESHGGSTYCALAALTLTNQMHTLSQQQVEMVKRWCVKRQLGGFQGRPHKPADTCYSFWVGGALTLLGCPHWIHAPSNRSYVMSTQDNVIGGFAKWPDTHPDPLHAFLGLAGLSLNGEDGLTPIEPFLPITKRAHLHLKRLHSNWMSS